MVLSRLQSKYISQKPYKCAGFYEVNDIHAINYYDYNSVPTRNIWLDMCREGMRIKIFRVIVGDENKRYVSLRMRPLVEFKRWCSAGI